MMQMTSLEQRQQRNFGVLVGGVFLIIGLFPALRYGTTPLIWSLTLGALLIVLGMASPGMLYWPNRLWTTIGHGLGWLNTRVILVMIFFLLAVPIAFIRRLCGSDPLKLAPHLDAGQIRVRREPRPPDHMKNQF